jgi:hypothetical protein
MTAKIPWKYIAIHARVDTGGPLTDANRHPPASVEDQLNLVSQAWTRLPNAIRAGIVAMIEAAKEI